MRKLGRTPALAAAVVLLVSGGCSGDDGVAGEGGSTRIDVTRVPSPSEEPQPEPEVTLPSTRPAPAASAPDVRSWQAARSRTREDSYYPQYGDPGVDTLHHDLSLAWDDETRLLTGRDVITLRPTRDAPRLRLDLGQHLDVDGVWSDGRRVQHSHEGKDLLVLAPVRRDRVVTLTVTYSGTPEPVSGPTERIDLVGLGFTITGEGDVWTMQEPYGAFTWYPVNDQPADKAFYDVTVRTAAPRVGVSNGTLTSRTTRAGVTTTRFRNRDPMASYLLTLGIGDYVHRSGRTASGVPLHVWALRSDRRKLRHLRDLRRSLEWAERRLGPYPFESAGLLLVDGGSGMETQSLLTINRRADLTGPLLTHELVHQWYGDLVGPSDWRDLWMNEGMTTYLAEGVYDAETTGTPLSRTLRSWRRQEPGLRRTSGPPGAYDSSRFADSTVYVIPALMWHEIRGRVGEEAFWSLVRELPRTFAYSTATRQEYLDRVEAATGHELTAVFDHWLTGSASAVRR